MRYLLAINGVTNDAFGILASPKMAIPEGIKNGMVWAADLGAIEGPSYVKRFDKNVALSWLEKMKPYKPRCLWILAPDIVGDAERTHRVFDEMCQFINDEWHGLDNWPIAYAAQDGQENWAFPLRDWHCLFVGGTTKWKTSHECFDVIKRAQKLGKQIHIARVNTWRRYSLFRALEGSNAFTCDGTKQRFVGAENAIKSWEKYMKRHYDTRMFR